MSRPALSARLTRLLVATLVAAGCGPADRVGHDVITDESAVRASGGAGRGRGASGGAPAAGASGMIASAASGSGAAGASGTAAASSNDHTSSGSSADTNHAGASGTGSAGAGSAGTSGTAATPTTSGTGGTTFPAAGSGGSSTPPTAGSAAGSGEPAGPVDPECDFNGVWIARLTTFSRDSVFSSVQTASNWFYYEISHHGRELKVTSALDCGFQVSGSAEITLTTATMRALLRANDQTGRSGEFYKDADHCALRIQRWYSVRGVPRATYLPADITSQTPELDTIQPPLPTEQAPMGAVDIDQDGMPGLGINVSGLGSRHVVQRDWNEFWSDDASIALHSTEILARARFDVDEQIMAVSGGLGALLRAGATPAADMRHRILFKRIAKTPSEAAAGSVRVADDDLETCYNVQESLPHDPVMQ